MRKNRSRTAQKRKPLKWQSRAKPRKYNEEGVETLRAAAKVLDYAEEKVQPTNA